MQCWCKTNGDEKTKSIEEAQTKIKALERGGVESHVSGDMQDIGRLRKKTVGSLGMSFYIYRSLFFFCTNHPTKNITENPTAAVWIFVMFGYTKLYFGVQQL